MTLGNCAGAIAVSVLVLLGHTGDGTQQGSRPTVGEAGPEPVRALPVPADESEPPRSAEPAVPLERPRPSAAAPSSTPPVARKSGPPPGRAAAGGLAQKESAPAPANPTPKSSAPAAETAPAAEPATGPAPRPETPRPIETAPPVATAPPPPAPAAAATLDLGSLEKRLRETKAIGVFTKLSLKNQVDDLLDEFREFHKTRDRSMLTRLRQAYDLLLLKVLSLLQDDDPGLARDVASSREALWGILTDPDTFKDL